MSRIFQKFCIVDARAHSKERRGGRPSYLQVYYSILQLQGIWKKGLKIFLQGKKTAAIF